MKIYGYVPDQFPNIASGISALISSGNANSDITDFYLYIDDGLYSGVLSATIPNSGTFNIIGNGTNFIVNGTSNINTKGNGSLNISNVDIISDSYNDWIFNISNDSNLYLEKSNIISANNGIRTSGNFISNDCSFNGNGSGVFCSGYSLSCVNTSIANFDIGVYSDDATITNSYFNNCNTSIYTDQQSNLFLDGSLIHGSTYGIYKNQPSNITIINSTISSQYPIYGASGVISLNDSIFNASGYCITGPLANGSSITNCGLFPSGYVSSNVVNVPIEVNNKSVNPKFNNTSMGDYRLKFGVTDGSAYIEHVSKNVPDDVSLTSEISNIVFGDDNGNLNDIESQQFLYKQGSTIALTDHNKEVEFSHFIAKHNSLKYVAVTQVAFSTFEEDVRSCFSSNGNHTHPYDWNLKQFHSPEIVDSQTDTQYIIPRSYIDISSIVSSKLGFLGDVDFKFDSITKQNIKVYNKDDMRGVSYDYDLSGPSTPILWTIEGRNQLLQKQNLFTSENLESYPLLCPYLGDNNMTTISGLVFAGPDGDRFRFIKVSDPDLSYSAESQDGLFKWIDTSIAPQFDCRGVLSYKNNLYITATRYSEDIYNRTSIPILEGNGLVLKYSNNHLFSHYIKNIDNQTYDVMTLHPENKLPTDLTVYEDGNIFIADYLNQSGVYRYKFAYDYAIMEEQYEKLSRIILREYYPEVDF